MNDREEMLGRLITLTELATALGVPMDWLEAEAEAGRIPCLRAGKRYRFALVAVEAALVERASNERVNVTEIAK